MTPYFRISTGVSTGLAFSSAVPVYFSWLPWGADRYGVYLEGGATMIRTRECCGGPERGGSAAKTTFMPTAGAGVTFQGDIWVIKAGMDVLVDMADDKIKSVMVPGGRIGFRFWLMALCYSRGSCCAPE